MITGFLFLLTLFDADAQIKPAQSQYLNEKGILVNPSFEQGYKGWDDTTSTCTKSLGVTVPFLDRSYNLTCTAQNPFVKQESTSLAVLTGKKYIAQCFVKADGGDVLFSSLSDGSIDKSITVASGEQGYYTIRGDIGATSNGVQLSGTGLTGTFSIDDCSLRYDKSFLADGADGDFLIKDSTQPDNYLWTSAISGSTLQANEFARVLIPASGNGGCSWYDRVTTGFQPVVSDADCGDAAVGGQIVGSITMPDTKVPSFTLNNVVAGNVYQFDVSSLVYKTTTTTNVACAGRLRFNGSDVAITGSIFNGTNGNTVNSHTASASYSYTAPTNGDLTVEFQISENILNTCQIDTRLQEWSMSVKEFPAKANTVAFQNTTIEEYNTTGWVDGVCVSNWDASITNTCRYRRMGDTMHVKGRVLVNSTPILQLLQVTIPDGFEADGSKVSLSTKNQFGYVSLSDFTGATWTNGRVSVANSTTMRMLYLVSGSNNYGYITQAVPFAMANGDLIYYEYQVPIVGWDVTTTKPAVIAGTFEQIESVDVELDATTANVFTAEVNVDGVVFGENFDWINGNCVESGVSPFTVTCTYNSSIFTESPICTTSIENSNDVSYTAKVRDASTTAVGVIRFTGSNANPNPNLGFNITCIKKGIDVNKTIKGAVISASESAVKCQTKQLGSLVTSVGAIPDVVFNNITIGRRYNVYGWVLYSTSTSAIGDKFVFGQSAGLTHEVLFGRRANDIGQWSHRDSISMSSTADATTISFEVTDITLNERVAALNVTLCEVPETWTTTTQFN